MKEAQPAVQPLTTAFTLSPFSLGILNMGEFLHRKIKTHAGVSSSLAFCLPLQAPYSSVGGHMASLGIALEEKPSFAFEWLHWVINSALAFDPKETACNSVMLRVELQRRGDIFFPRMAPRWEAFSRDHCSCCLSLAALFVSLLCLSLCLFCVSLCVSLCLPGPQPHWAGRTRLPRSDLYLGSMYTVAPGT